MRIHQIGSENCDGGEVGGSGVGEEGELVGSLGGLEN